ncbi:hypothetical protein [Pontibacter harenae]|uniref:hypothetical protein n=1 Tax=Pontibacter harenae TaxID=2894083 RepID=UPI001E3E67D5|nr:hypothetical protein [Pontibacter harenae]MCC9165418.1 hypothetical protein [Pontibacter harenae]
MPYKHTQPGGADSGNPSGRGQSKAGAKPVDPNQTRDEHEELKEKYTKGPDELADGIRTNNVNRNLHKPGIDNNKYN